VRPFPSVLGRAFDVAVIVGFALASFYAAARIGLEPRDPARGVGVIFAPWTAADAALVRAVEAGGRVVRFGGLPFVVVVEPESADYIERIKAAGALLIVDPLVITACLPSSITVPSRK
jgi:hypothetical protein